MREIFDINVTSGLTGDDSLFAKRMFHRRHVYEHRGGQADQKYIDDSGESDVRVGQALRESIETAHRVVDIIHKMARSVHAGFHDIIPVDQRPIERYEKWKPQHGPSKPKSPTL